MVYSLFNNGNHQRYKKKDRTKIPLIFSTCCFINRIENTHLYYSFEYSHNNYA